MRAWVRAHPRGAGRRRLRAALPADHQPARRPRRDLRSAAAHARRRTARSCRRTTFLPIAEEHGLLRRDRPLGRSAARSRLIAERAAPARTPRCCVKITPGLAGRTTTLRSSSASSSRRTSVPGEHLVLQMPESKVFTHLRAGAGVPDDRGAASAAALALEQFGTGLNSFQLLHALRPGAAEDRPQLHRRPGQEHGEPGEGQGDSRARGAQAGQADHRRVRAGRGQHDDPVLERRRLRAGQLPCRRRAGDGLRLPVSRSRRIATKKPADPAGSFHLQSATLRHYALSHRARSRLPVAQRLDALLQRRMAHEQALAGHGRRRR